MSLIVSVQYSFTWMIFKINQEYIATNLCVQKDIEENSCQGCCQLKKEMQQTEKQEKSNPNQSQRKLTIDLFNTSSLTFKKPDVFKIINYHYGAIIMVDAFYARVFKPPQV